MTNCDPDLSVNCSEPTGESFICSQCDSNYSSDEKYRCVTCNYCNFCSNCISPHTIKAHTIIDYMGRTPLNCAHHSLLVYLFCETCEVCLCALCVPKHSRHTFIEIVKKATECRKEVFRLLDESDALAKPLKSQLQSLTDVKQAIIGSEADDQFDPANMLEIIRPSVEAACDEMRQNLETNETTFDDEMGVMRSFAVANDSMTGEIKSLLQLNDSELVKCLHEKLKSLKDVLENCRKSITEKYRCIVSVKRLDSEPKYENLVRAIREFILPEQDIMLASLQKSRYLQITIGKLSVTGKSKTRIVGKYLFEIWENRYLYLHLKDAIPNFRGKRYLLDEGQVFPNFFVVENDPPLFVQQIIEQADVPEAETKVSNFRLKFAKVTQPNCEISNATPQSSVDTKITPSSSGFPKQKKSKKFANKSEIKSQSGFARLDTGSNVIAQKLHWEELSLENIWGDPSNLLAVRVLLTEDAKNTAEVFYWSKDDLSIKSTHSDFIVQCASKPISFYLSEDLLVFIETNDENEACSIYNVERWKPSLESYTVITTPHLENHKTSKNWLISRNGSLVNVSLVLVDIDNQMILILEKKPGRNDCKSSQFRWKVIAVVEISPKFETDIEFVVISWITISTNGHVDYLLRCLLADGSVRQLCSVAAL